jgi:hypothetical protein
MVSSSINLLEKSTIIANKIVTLYQQKKDSEAIDLYNNRQNFFAPGMSSKKIDPQKCAAKEKIIDVLELIAIHGNEQDRDDAQLCLTERLFGRCILPIEKSSRSLEEQKEFDAKYSSCAFELFNFLFTLSEKNILIPLSNDIKKIFIQEINTNDSPVSYILESCRYLHATTTAEQKNILTSIKNKKCENPEIKEICQFLLNYSDLTVSINDTVKKFIHTIQSQTDASPMLLKIAEEPIYTSVIHKLHKATLEKEDPDLPNLHLVLAELYFYGNNLIKAYEFYSKLNKENIINNTINPQAFEHVFESYLAHIQEYSQENMDYLFSLVGNLHDQLQKTQRYNKHVSYGVGLLTYNIIKGSDISSKKIIPIIKNGLDHLAYVHDKKKNDHVFLQKTINLTIKLSMLLSEAHDKNGDRSLSLDYMMQAMRYRNNQQDNEILKILDNAKKGYSLYTKHVPLINTIIQFINKLPQKNYLNDSELSALPEFSLSDLCAQLIPYCEQAYKTHKKNTHEAVLYLISLYYKNKGTYAIANYYINQLPQPLSKNALLLKTEIYTALNKPLSHQEIEIIITKLINNKVPQKNYATIASAALLSKDFFITSSTHYELALKFITKFADAPHIPSGIITLMSYVKNHLINSSDPYIDTWQKTILTPQFCNKFSDPSDYNADTNYIIANHLLTQTTLNYEKIIAHFSAALKSKTLTDQTINEIQNKLNNMYYQGALSNKHDAKKFIALIDSAISLYNNAEARYEKAAYILENNYENQILVKEALNLLKINSKENSPMKDTSLILLGMFYLNLCPFSKTTDNNKKIVPLDIKKSIKYLEKSASFTTTELLTFIYAGAISSLDIDAIKQYIDLKKAIEYATILINNNYNKFTHLLLRKNLYITNNDHINTLKDIETLLHFEGTQLTQKIKIDLLCFKISCILEHLINNNDYNDVLICLKEYRLLCNQNDYVTDINKIFHVTAAISNIIKNNIKTDSAIELCCLAAEGKLLEKELLNSSSNDYHIDLLNYFISAAKESNIDAQLIIMPYWVAVNKTKDTTILTEEYTDYLYYAHTALTDTNLSTKTRIIDPLISCLYDSTKIGFALPYYILCNYYKNNTKEFNNLLILFNQATIQFYQPQDTKNIIHKICSSCIDTLNKYAIRYAKNPEKANPINTLATLTLASMLQYSNDISHLMRAIAYYNNILLHPLPQQYKSPNRTITSLLGWTHFNKAMIEKNINHKSYLDSLILSARYGYLPGCYQLAKEYIEQHNCKKVTLTINHFFQLIMKDITANKANPNPEHIDIAKKLILIKEELDKRKTTLPDMNFIAQKYPLVHTINIPIIISPEMLKLKIQFTNNSLTPTTVMTVAFNHLIGTTFFKKNYELSQKISSAALKYGLHADQCSNNSKKFHNNDFLSIFCTYMQTLIKIISLEPSEKNKGILVSTLDIIHQTLKKTGIESTFYQFFKEYTSIDLQQGEWKLK